MKKFKKCYLHIGTEKTGSTSIQRYLEKNRDKLVEQGHYYPKCFGPRRGSHYYLSVYSRHEDHFDDLRIISGVVDKASLNEFRENLHIEADKEFQDLELDVLHISCENFHSRLQGVDSIKRLKLFLEKYCDSFTVICYFRPQHDVLMSLYSTALKNGGGKKDIDITATSNNHYYNYYKMIELWNSVFGYSNIKARNFSRRYLASNDLITDYCKLTYIENSAFVDVDIENESLSREALLFLEMVNKYLPRIENGKATGYRRDLASLMEINFPGKYFIMTKTEAKDFYSRFESSNSALNNKYLKGNALEPEFEMCSDLIDFAPFSIEDCKNIAIKILSFDSKKSEFESFDKIMESSTKEEVCKSFSMLWLNRG
jgi:hypothetical protein